MTIYLVTLFPEMVLPVLQASILGKAIHQGRLHVQVIQLRDFATDKRKNVDAKPFGGSAGMILRADVLANCVNHITQKHATKPFTIALSPQGKCFHRDDAVILSQKKELIFICGHYEGMDQRFLDHYVDQEISIGDFVLTGGELPALVMIDALSRFIPGVVGNADCVHSDSFENYLLKYPQYTKPAVFEGVTVPDVLRSGNHQKILEWQKKTQIHITRNKRPDLYQQHLNAQAHGTDQSNTEDLTGHPTSLAAGKSRTICDVKKSTDQEEL